MKASKLYSALFLSSLVGGALTLSACNPGGSEGTTIAKASYVKVEDANINGALVTDANGQVASEIENGVYRFASIPSLPVKILSQNKLSSDNTYIDEINNTTGVAPSDNIPDPGTILTYQDMDGDNKFDFNVDIPFNGALNIKYRKTGDTNPDFTANPVTALIPANWDGNTSVAGMKPEVVNRAIDSGVDGQSLTDTSSSKSTEAVTVKSKSGLYVSIMEYMIRLGATPDQTAQFIDFVSQNSGALDFSSEDFTFEKFIDRLANLVDSTSDNSDSLETELNLDDDLAEAIRSFLINYLKPIAKSTLDPVLEQAEKQDAAQADTTKTDEEKAAEEVTEEQITQVNFVEAVIKPVQNPETKELETVEKAVEKTNWDEEIEEAKNEIDKIALSAKQVLVEQLLYLVPSFNQDGSRDTSFTDLNVTDFSMGYSDNNDTITINSPSFTSYHEKVLNYNTEAQGYIFNGDDKMGVTLSITQAIPLDSGNLNTDSGLVKYATGRLLSYRTQAEGILHIAFLAKKEEICSSGFKEYRDAIDWDPAKQKTLLTIINEINNTTTAERPVIVCNQE